MRDLPLFLHNTFVALRVNKSSFVDFVRKLVFAIFYLPDNQCCKSGWPVFKKPCNISKKMDIVQADLFKKDSNIRLLIKKSLLKPSDNKFNIALNPIIIHFSI